MRKNSLCLSRILCRRGYVSNAFPKSTSGILAPEALEFPIGVTTLYSSINLSLRVHVYVSVYSFPSVLSPARTVILFQSTFDWHSDVAYLDNLVRASFRRWAFAPTAPTSAFRTHNRSNRSLDTRERSLWSRSDPPNNSHETPLPFPPVPPPHEPSPSSPSRATSSSSTSSFLSLSCLFLLLLLSRLFALADCVPTFLRSLFLSFVNASTSAQSRVWVCAVVLVVSLPRLATPLSPPPRGSAASRVIAARYRGFLRRASLRGSTRHDAPRHAGSRTIRDCTGSRSLHWVLRCSESVFGAPRYNVYRGRDTTRLNLAIERGEGW